MVWWKVVAHSKPQSEAWRHLLQAHAPPPPPRQSVWLTIIPTPPVAASTAHTPPALASTQPRCTHLQGTCGRGRYAHVLQYLPAPHCTCTAGWVRATSWSPACSCPLWLRPGPLPLLPLLPLIDTRRQPLPSCSHQRVACCDAQPPIRQHRHQGVGDDGEGAVELLRHVVGVPGELAAARIRGGEEGGRGR